MADQQRDAFPLERLARVETIVDGHVGELIAVRELIRELSLSQDRTQKAIVDEMVTTRLEVAGLREVASSTRIDVRGLKRIVTGGIVSIVVALLIERVTG